MLAQKNKRENESIINYILAGFGFAFLLFFFIPAFLNPEHKMMFPGTFMAADFIGSDLKTIVLFVGNYFNDGISPYMGEYYYPPFTVLFFAPFMVLPHFGAYVLITIFSFSLYLLYLAFYPLKLSNNKFFTPLLVFFVITGLLSYGFQFEIERGQFNVISVVLCVTAIYIFHNKPKLRLLAYFLFIISVQLKIYPIIFILLLVDDWHAWKQNLLRFAILGFVNVLFLFVMGAGLFSDFLYNVFYYTENPVSWTGNHSISSFITLVTQKSVERLGITHLAWTASFAPAVRIFLLLSYLLILIFTIKGIYKRNEKGFNNILFFVCMIGAQIIPPVSHDYKLALMTLPVVLLFIDFEKLWCGTSDNITKVLLLFASFLYSSLLFSYTTKHIYIGNSFPVLFLMLLVMVYLNDRLKKIAVQPRM
jgi:hypothetical protein